MLPLSVHFRFLYAAKRGPYWHINEKCLGLFERHRRDYVQPYADPWGAYWRCVADQYEYCVWESYDACRTQSVYVSWCLWRQSKHLLSYYLHSLLWERCQLDKIKRDRGKSFHFSIWISLMYILTAISLVLTLNQSTLKCTWSCSFHQSCCLCQLSLKHWWSESLSCCSDRKGLTFWSIKAKPV